MISADSAAGRHLYILPDGQQPERSMELADYLRSVDIVATASPLPPIVLREVRQGPVAIDRPPLDAVSLLAPVRPVTAQFSFEGRATHHTLRRGDIALIPANTPARLELGPLDAVAAWISPGAIEVAANALDPLRTAPPKLRPSGSARDSLLSSLAIELCHEMAEPSIVRQFYADALATSLLTLIVKHYADGGATTRESGPVLADDRIRRARAYIDERFLTDLSLIDVAREAGLSLPHLTELFRSGTGQSIWQYVKRRRLQHARQLLDMSGLSIADVAAGVGYLSVSHFSQSFRAEFGVGPGTYRKRGSNPLLLDQAGEAGS